MAFTFDESEYFDEDFEDTLAQEKGKRKSTKGRQLMRWDVAKDQYLLLLIDHVCARDGVALPWDAIGAMLTPKLTPEAIKQHLSKVIKHRQSEGFEVPPTLDKSARKRVVKPAVKATTPASSTRHHEEEIPKRSTLLPPPKPGRRTKKVGGGTQRGKKGTNQKVNNLEAPASPEASVQSFDYPHGYVPALLYQTDGMAMPFPPMMTPPMDTGSHFSTHAAVMTADQQQVLALNNANAHAGEPRLEGIRNDIFLGVGQPDEMQPFQGTAWPLLGSTIASTAGMHAGAMLQDDTYMPARYDLSAEQQSFSDNMIQYDHSFQDAGGTSSSSLAADETFARPAKRARTSNASGSSGSLAVIDLGSDSAATYIPHATDAHGRTLVDGASDIHATATAQHNTGHDMLATFATDETHHNTAFALSGDLHDWLSADGMSSTLLSSDFSMEQAWANTAPRSHDYPELSSGTESQLSVSSPAFGRDSAPTGLNSELDHSSMDGFGMQFEDGMLHPTFELGSDDEFAAILKQDISMTSSSLSADMMKGKAWFE